MSSSRDHIIFTGLPGTAFAMVTPCRTKSWGAPRRPKPPPSIILWTSTFSWGTPAVSAAAAMDASPFWVDVHTSTKPSGFTQAVQTCGSIVAWLRYGEKYSASTTFAAVARAAAASPDFFAGTAFGSASPARSIARIVASDASPLPPVSHSTFSFFTASWARHQLSATTATKSAARTTCFTPRIFSASAESTRFTLPPNTGHCAIEACSIPGSITSVANTGLPSTLSGMSSLRSGLPAIFQSFGSRSATSFGGASFAACAATCP